MLKRFFLNMASSFVGAWLAFVLVAVSSILVILAMIGSFSISSNLPEQVTKRSILKIELNGAIEEREMAREPAIADVLNGSLSMPQTLDVIVQSIREAAKNDNIVCLYINCGNVAASTATLDAIRHEILEFKKSGKKVVAYGNEISQGCYYVASAADKIYLNPAGALSLTGLRSTSIYFKDLLDKLGVEFQVVKVGTYKSAVEPYIMQDMSEPARAQMDTLLQNMWTYIKKEIAASRKGVTPDKLDSIVSRDFISIARPELAVRSALVDSLVYERDFNKKLAEMAGVEVKKLNFVSPSTLVGQTPWGTEYNSKNQIAVVYACGEIADGNNNAINFETMAPLINKLADDENVKGLVLRVNSPGGSVFGSDQIGEALDYFQSKGKPVAVSMGDYAASGGYWISARANKIFADPLTITGSIGVFGLLPNFKGTLDKIGVNTASVATNPEANFPTGFTPLTDTQLNAMQKYVDGTYTQFVQRVAKGRKLSEQTVRRIGEGRVWDAMKAKEIGLVDDLGYLQDAIEWTAKQAKIYDKYDVAAYPEVEPNFWNIVLSNGMTAAALQKAVNGRDEMAVKAYLLSRTLATKPIQAKMPEIKVYL